MPPLCTLETIESYLPGLLPAERARRRQAELHAHESSLVRHDCHAHLKQVSIDLRHLRDTGIDISYAEEVDIAIRPLDLEEAGDGKGQENNNKRNVFFEPFDLDRLKEMKPDFRDENNRRFMDGQASDWESDTVDDREAEDALHSALVNQLDGYDRLVPDGKVAVSLPDTCGWLSRGSDAVLLDKYESFENVDDANDTPRALDVADTYIAHEDMGKPHVFITMINHCPPTDELLRVEALLILGVTLSRLEHAEFLAHRVMPINALSCFPRHKARMLQAYMTNRGMVIRKSDLFDFSTAEARGRNMPLFVSHMASRPVGDTQSLVYRLPDAGYTRLR
ncbi:hypothetical protein BJY00DRAFT_308907 [Aspergillus carlsbadensis]|nr:hypothetical protein BJY00DRAFT_308907 [Aspergillus carlsbadensis]